MTVHFGRKNLKDEDRSMNAISPVTIADFVSIEGRVLSRALKPFLFVVERRNTYPILGMIRLSVAGSILTVTGTDLDIEVAATLDVIDAQGEWSICVNPKALAAIARIAGPAALRMEVAGDELRITTDGAEYTLAPLSADGYPIAPGSRSAEIERFGNGSLAALLGKVDWCVSNEETRYYLNGVAWQRGENGSRLVATDGHRLAMCRYDGAAAADLKCIIPAKTVTLIRRFCAGVDIAVHRVVRPNEQADLADDPTRLDFVAPGVSIRSKLIEGTFPDVDRVIPKGWQYPFNFSRQDIVSAVTKATAFGVSQHSYGGTALHIKPVDGQVTVGTKSPDLGSSTAVVEAGWPKGAPEFGVNARYFREALNHCEGDIVLGVQDAGAPLRISDDDTTMTRILMPMRV